MILIQKIKSIPLSTIALMIVWFSVPSAYAEEDRCGTLGAACVCSEPLNTNQYTVGGASKNNWNPSDSTTKQCSHENKNHPITTGKATVGMLKFSNDSVMLSKLPVNNAINYALRALDGEPNYSTWRLGVYKLDASGNFPPVPQTRLAVRFYMYHSPDFSFASDLARESNNSKFFEGSDLNSNLWDDKDGKEDSSSYTLYGWKDSNGTTHAVKSGYDKTILSDNMKGVWFRFELIVTNRDAVSGNGTRLEMYRKDVTNGTPEVKMWDTATDKFTKGIYMGPNARPSGPLQTFQTNNYRQDGKNGIPLKGYRAISHYMVAGWNTDQGQRIGSALEVEGISGQYGVAGSPPSNWAINDYSIFLEP